MDFLRRFFGQKHRRYRNFQLVFTFFTLNFAIPAVSYVVLPEKASETVTGIGRILGGGDWTVPEASSHLWRNLGAANVMTLGLMCFLLQWNLRRYRVVLFPLAFLKGYNATLMLLSFALTRYPAFLAIGLYDWLTTAGFLFFARRAHAEIAGVPDAELVPSPRGAA